MKHTFHCLIFIFLVFYNHLNLFAQQKLAEFPVKISRAKEVFICSDSSGSIASVFQNNKQYEIDFLDSGFNHVQSAIAEKIKTDKNQKIIGAILDGGQCTAYFYNKKLKAFSLLSANQKTGETSFSRIYVMNVTDEFLRAFQMNGRFYILIVPKYGKTVNVLALKGKEMEEISFDIEMAGFYTALIKQNEMLNIPAESEVGIEEISYDLENNIKSSYPDKKLYHFNDKIYLVFDESGMTHFVTLDVNEKKSDYKKLIFDLERGNNSRDKQGNSFLFNNRLFRTTISLEQLNISVLDLDSMKLITSYNFYPNQDISILNGPMIMEGGGVSFVGDEKIIRRTDQYFKRVLDGNLAIAANKLDSNNFELQVGSYQIFQSSYNNRGGFNGSGISISMGSGMGMGGMGMGGMGMGGFGTPYGGMGMGFPGSYYGGFPGYYPYQTSTRQKIVYFKSILGNEKFDHIDGNVPISMKDRINDYETKAFRSNPPEVLRIASYKNSILLGYYAKVSKKFKILEFKN